MISRARLNTRRAALGTAAAAMALLGAGCATREQATDSFLGLVTPYRIDIVQGNAVTKEQVAQLKPGMTRQQVQAVLGSPMLTDPFHVNRWDYLFSIRRPGTDVQRRSVVVHFDGNAVKKVDAPDNLPTEIEFVASIAPARKLGTLPALELTDAQRNALPSPAKGPAAPALNEPTAAPRSFPPLEPR